MSVRKSRLADREYWCRQKDDCQARSFGLCMPCSNAKRAMCPIYRAQMSAQRRAAFERNPQLLIDSGRRLAASAPPLTAERARELQSLGSRRVLCWCPADRRKEYAALRNRHGAAEARRIIEADEAVQVRRKARANEQTSG